MVKFIKLKKGSAHEYFNVSNIVGMEKGISGFISNIALIYETTKSSVIKLNFFGQNLRFGDYIIEAVMNANSSSHTNNVYNPEITQGTQPTIGSIS